MSDVSFFRECALCGSNATLVYRWYKSDNGDQSRIPVCPTCAGLHSSLVKGK
jgi:protein-arginine kinase activator protein McsA